MLELKVSLGEKARHIRTLAPDTAGARSGQSFAASLTYPVSRSLTSFEDMKK